MIRAEYLRFLQTLTADDTSDDVRKIANLVLNNLDALIPLSTSHGQRIKKLVELSQANWTKVRADIEGVSQESATQSCPLTQLKSLSVGPFRGFAKQENFDLDSQLVLIYGPNGTGKSSFCEALEYSLLGRVAEAESKRFNLQDYLKNLHKNSFTRPTLIGLNNEGEDIPISADEALFRFCFIEKNRIENFSRIAAQTPAKQTELISTLFGLDAFVDFVRNFTDSMDDKHIDLDGVKAEQLLEMRQTLAVYQQQLKTTIPEELQSIEGEENKLANAYRAGCTFSEMVFELQGAEDKTGLIKQFEDELQKQIPTKSNVTLSSLKRLIQSIKAGIAEFEAKQTALSKDSLQISFKQLYEAVTNVQENSAEQCPACQTPLTQVKINPFDHAYTELKKLEHLSRLQEEVKKLQESIVTLLNQLSAQINSCCSRISENNSLLEVQILDGKSATIDWWVSLLQQSGDGKTYLQQLQTQIKKLENDDKMIDNAVNERKQKQEKLDQLRKLNDKIVGLETRSKTAINNKGKAEEAIARFETENAQLIADVEAEKKTIVQNKLIANAYADFVQKLNVYKNKLPALLIKDLSENVVKLYNAFNRNDADNEKLANIRLPLKQNQRLKISFKSNSDKFYDALHILSEGHIRCIGLAILTAKNLKENCPLLIFDDPVIAIDDEHRESIRRTLFQDSFFSGKQILLAFYGEEFFKDIQNLLPAEQARRSKAVTFLPRNGNDHIRVDFNCTPRNYIIAARNHYKKGEIRDALDKSRKALESLTKAKVWKYVKLHGDGNLSIKMRSPSSPIELRNLTEQLKSKIEKNNFSDQKKDAVLNPIKTLLGINGDSREWRYLNKGTHEEENRPEFDSLTVNNIIASIEAIDKALEKKRS